MKRSDFLKCLAAVIVAPSVLVSLPETVTTAQAAADPALFEGSAVTMAANQRTMNAFFWKVTTTEVQDKEWMMFLLSDPRSSFWEKAGRHGVDLTKPHELMMGPCQDDFVRDLMTIVVRQPIKAAA